jgi:CRP/FNR family transcriptional regulator, cyclic AMP receptor protein
MPITEKLDFRNFARSMGTVMTYQAGDTVFRENDTPQFMYVVLTGAVEISSHGKSIESIHAGDAFGILPLLDDQPIPITARASESTDLALIDRKKFRFMVEELPNFVWYVMSELAHRLRTTNAAL